MCPQVDFVFACYDVGGRSRLSMSELFLLLKSTTAGLCKLSGTDAPDSARFECVASLVSLLPGRGSGGSTRGHLAVKPPLAPSLACAYPRHTPPPCVVGHGLSTSSTTDRYRFCRGDHSSQTASV